MSLSDSGKIDVGATQTRSEGLFKRQDTDLDSSGALTGRAPETDTLSEREDSRVRSGHGTWSHTVPDQKVRPPRPPGHTRPLLGPGLTSLVGPVEPGSSGLSVLVPSFRTVRSRRRYPQTVDRRPGDPVPISRPNRTGGPQVRVLGRPRS